MKTCALFLPVGLSLLSLSPDEPKGPDEPKAGEPGTEETKKAIELTPLEQGFRDTLQNSTLVGRWRLVRDGKLGEEREEKYSIRTVAKIGQDQWVIGARIQYGQKDVTVPVPVRVLWAGDTPVITLTKAGIPGLGTYTARVMVYEGLYSGTWFGSDHGGFLSGAVVKDGGDGSKK